MPFDERFGELLPGTTTVLPGKAFRLGPIAEADLPPCTPQRDGEMRLVAPTAGGANVVYMCNGGTATWESIGGATTPVTGTQTIPVPLGDGVSSIPAGVHKDWRMPHGGIWTKWTLLGTKFSAGSTGNLVADVGKDTYANFPPTFTTDSITGSSVPTLSAANHAESSTLTGWNSTFSAGDVFRVNIGAGATVTQGTLLLDYTPVSGLYSSYNMTIGDGVNVIPAGIWDDLRTSVAGIWKAWTVLATKPDGTAGSVVLDAWSDAYGNYPPTVADTITGTDKPTLSAAIKNTSTALTGWDTSFAAGDTIRINVDSASTLKLVTLVLDYQRA